MLRSTAIVIIVFSKMQIRLSVTPPPTAPPHSGPDFICSVSPSHDTLGGTDKGICRPPNPEGRKPELLCRSGLNFRGAMDKGRPLGGEQGAGRHPQAVTGEP